MNISKTILAILLPLGAMACQSGSNTNANSPQEENFFITENLRFCESVLWHQDALYIANFGSEECNPLNTEGKGYIAVYKDGKVDTLLKPDGQMNAPKGMAVKDSILYIADVNSLLVYSLKDKMMTPRKIQFPENDMFVNDLAIKGNTLYASVTNTGNIYTIELGNNWQTDPYNLVLWTNVRGANGIKISKNIMYVASYNPQGEPNAENVIYFMELGLNAPVVKKLTDRIGMYDGLLLSKDGTTLYFTSWINGEVGKIDNSGVIDIFSIQDTLIGPADMDIKDNTLYIPDLPNSRVLVMPL